MNDHDHSTADDDSGADIDTSVTEPPAPVSAATLAPELVRAAIKPLYMKYLTMGKKKLLRILNTQQGWSIGSKEFRSHFEAISGPIETGKGGDGD